MQMPRHRAVKFCQFPNCAVTLLASKPLHAGCPKCHPALPFIMLIPEYMLQIHLKCQLLGDDITPQSELNTPKHLVYISEITLSYAAIITELCLLLPYGWGFYIPKIN